MKINDEQHSGQFWIDEFKIDPDSLWLNGPAGQISLEPKVMQVLMKLASKPGELIFRDELMDAVWAVEFGSDESLTRAISVLRKGFGDAHGRRAIIETVPRRGYRLIGSVSQKDPKHKITNSTVKASTLSTHDANTPFHRQILIIVGAVLLLALSAYVFTKKHSTMPDKIVIEKHAFITNLVYVSPFETNSITSDLEVFANRLLPQITSLLSETGVLTSIDDKTNAALQEFDLEGGVDDQGDVLQVTVRLIDHKTQLIIWSEMFTRPSAQMSIFSDEVSAGTATVIACILNMRSEKYDTKTETLRLYARFCNAYSRKRYNDAISDFKLLTEPIYRAEPDNPKAMALYAWSLSLKARFDTEFTNLQKEKFRRQSKELVDAALIADPQALLANFLRANSLGWVGHWSEAEKLMEPASSKYGMPDFVYQEYATFLQAVGRLQDSISIFEKMVSLNPTDIFSRTQLGWLFAVQGRLSDSKQQFALVERYDPDSTTLRDRRLQVDLFIANAESARLRMNNMRSSGRRNMVQTIDCYKTFLRFKWFDAPDSEALLKACTHYHPIWHIRMLTGIGDIERAYSIAEKYDWNTHDGVPIVLFYPDMEPFRNDPRFWPLVKKIGLVKYWQETGKWPDFCKTDNLLVDCKTAAEKVNSSDENPVKNQ